MSIFDDIRKDAEKGTQEWRAEQPHFANGWWVVFTDPDTDATVDQSGDGGFLEHTARRIARVPQLEAIALAAEELSEVARFGQDMIRGDSVGSDWKRQNAEYIRRTKSALNAFRKATKERDHD